MKSLIKILLVLFFLFCLSPTLTNATSNSTESDLQEYYKQMYVDQKDYNDRILNTIYWALGGLATAIISVVGLNVFNSNRSNKASLEVIKQEVLKINEIENSKNVTMLRQEFDQLRDQTSNVLNEQLQQRDQIINERFTLIQTDLSNNVEEVNSKIENVVKFNHLQIKEIERKLKAMKIDIYKNKADIKGLNQHGALSQLGYLVQKLELEIELEYPLQYFLDDFLIKLQEIKEVDAMLHHQISTVVNKIPDIYNGLKTRLNEVLSDIKIS
jgi:hypothetical protein